jgi:hypothetical protein
MNIMEQKRKEMKEEFLALTPAQRIQQMELLFNEFVRLRAKREGISENEAYLRYAERNRKPARLIKPRKPFRDKEDKDQLL